MNGECEAITIPRYRPHDCLLVREVLYYNVHILGIHNSGLYLRISLLYCHLMLQVRCIRLMMEKLMVESYEVEVLHEMLIVKVLNCDYKVGINLPSNASIECKNKFIRCSLVAIKNQLVIS